MGILATIELDEGKLSIYRFNQKFYAGFSDSDAVKFADIGEVARFVDSADIPRSAQWFGLRRAIGEFAAWDISSWKILDEDFAADLKALYYAEWGVVISADVRGGGVLLQMADGATASFLLDDDDEIRGLRLVAEHINSVQADMAEGIGVLTKRMIDHDKSKYTNEELILVGCKPRLDKTEYGSHEYNTLLDSIEPAVKHHYRSNSHHPEHHADGVLGMSLFDLFEMLCDWKASGDSVSRCLDVNAERYDISEETERLLRNTIAEMGWT